ncbi:MAG: trehalose-phosphatase [Actinobacteria bacterium]|nr:trehalose-phosphatase [Actinomycetota bacterium]
MNDELLAPFRAAPERAGIFTDFDGTLSRIVEKPAEARPVSGAREVLSRLGHRFSVVSVVSGRAAGELLEWLGDDIEIWGVHGAETVVDGHVVLSKRAEPYRDLMTRVLTEAQHRVAALGIEGVVVEDKRVMVGLHFRAAEDVERAGALLDGIADDLVQEFGLQRAGGRLAFELRPPETFTKQDIVLARTREADLEAVLFAGDDLVDLPAFDALDTLASEGVATVRVAVASDEAPTELVERADVVVAGPEETIEFFERLLS